MVSLAISPRCHLVSSSAFCCNSSLFVTNPSSGGFSGPKISCVGTDRFKDGAIPGPSWNGSLDLGEEVSVSFSSGSNNIGIRAAGGYPERIGSRRKRGGGLPPEGTASQVEDKGKEPFLQAYMRGYREEGHQALDDGETLLAKASNPYGLVLQIAEEANEYLRNNKEESLKRKPILKVISDRINEAYGEGLRDSYINEKEDNSEFEQ